jgi:hypothetical protein
VKVFIWERVDELTLNYHASGGLVVFADTEARARELVTASGATKLAEGDRPDHVREVDGGEELVLKFPNAGCC